MSFTGSMTAVVTPFRDGRIDEESLRRLVDGQIRQGTDGIVACGTTGESATLSKEEVDRVIRVTVEAAGGRVPVIAGSGSNSTATAIALTKIARAAGADGSLQVTPYYNKPTQEGLFQHFRAIAQVVEIPVILYNVPGRTAVNMLPETVERLAHIDTIVGVKEASGNLDQVSDIIARTPASFVLLSGDDALNLEIYRRGGKGCISVTANVVPSRVARVWDLFAQGNIDAATREHASLEALNRDMFIETNPIPAKTAVALLGHCQEEFRLPMTPMGQANRETLIRTLTREGLLP